MTAELMLPQEMVDPTTLNPHPMNPKLHNTDLLAASVAKGLYRPIVINRGTHTGRPNEILAGHGTREAWMEAHPGEPIQVTIVDVDDARAKEILLIDNPGPHDPGYDNEALAELLSTMAGDMQLTGWNEEDLETLQRIIDATAPPGGDITDPRDEWWDMPDVPDTIDGKNPARRVIVSFATDDAFDEFMKRIDQAITSTAKTVSIWFPAQEVRPFKEFRVVGNDEPAF